MMTSWTAVALALTEPGEDEMESRLATYLHPLAGRPLVWHTLSALASIDPAPDRILLLTRAPLNPEMFDDFPADIEMIEHSGGERRHDIEATLASADSSLLVANAAMPLLGSSLQQLLDAPPGHALLTDDGWVAAARIAPTAGMGLIESVGTHSGADFAAPTIPIPTDEAVWVHDRVSLARAVGLMRDRIIGRMMAAGATFLLPETTLVDTDVTVGRDTIIYPGVVLEGQTSIGDETVIGPGCRVIDSWIGSGVELKGWNYVARSSVRNRAILEPYVRRGFD